MGTDNYLNDTGSGNTLNSQHPLVSIIVITYNSGNFVLETLESALSQTYRNIELIISDDCSTDNTVELIQKWLKEHETRFIRTELITARKNTGIASNGNRGLNAANGIWLKYIAGDDILQTDCIKDCLEFIFLKPETIECLFAQNKQFTGDETIKINASVIPDPEIFPFYRTNATAREQYNLLLNTHKFWPLSTSSFFIKRDLMKSLGGYDERYEFMEDLPLFLKILERNIKIYFLPKVTVLYRIHKNSVLRESTEQVKLNRFRISKNQFIKDYVLKRVPWPQKIRLMHELLFDRLVLLSGNKGAIANAIDKIGITLNPVRLNWFRRNFNKIFRRHDYDLVNIGKNSYD
jgi:glycosyltransferase involved in cell wall biosynthesis